MVGTRLWARARAWESMPLASSKPRTSLRHACNNQAQVSSRSSPGGVPRLFERLLEAAQPISQRKLAVLKALGDREGSNVDLSCSAGCKTGPWARRAKRGARLQTPPTTARLTSPTCRWCASSPRWSPAPKHVRGAAMCSKSVDTVSVNVARAAGKSEAASGRPEPPMRRSGAIRVQALRLSERLGRAGVSHGRHRRRHPGQRQRGAL